MNTDTWIFGYGSLLWRPDFDFTQQCAGHITGHERRFCQASPDHRGTPELPGRVVTLVPSDDACCWGIAYQLAPESREHVLEQLDRREQNGYERLELRFQPEQEMSTFAVTTYIATETNPSFVSTESVRDTVARIAAAHGPSGSNLDYLFQLESALESLGRRDEHVTELADALRALNPS